jgi:multimeric flavodoxin WrbA
MRIALINGSPKLNNSNSAFLLKRFEPLISTGNEIIHYTINSKPLTEEQYLELCQMDVLVIAFPLYIDAIPSHLFRMFVTLEEYMKTERKKDIYVYAIANNGFFEGKQNHIAFEIINNWCLRCGLHFGQGIGQGGGEMIGFTGNVPLGHGPLKNLGNTMKALANNIQSGSTEPSTLFNPNLPRFAWRFTATHFFWNANAKKNGLKKKDIMKRL